MKNLKKVLALVLVVATLFGFATVVGATDFSDSASVKNTEAVEVMNALGVINGYTDGSFKPGNNVTRAEMAKMVTAILNGGEDVGPLYSAANVFTDCGYHWARGYIAYATQVKLVAGIGNGKFNPDGNVTGTEAAKMLLCALGYEPEREGLVGTTWAAKTLSLARESGLTDGFAANFDFSKPLSRDNAALLMLNALKADMVEYNDDAGTIIVGVVEVVTGGGPSHAVTVTKNASNAWASKITEEDGPYTVQLGEKSFDGDLELKTTGVKAIDAFGRPSFTWIYNKKDIGTYTNDDGILTYDTTVKIKDAYADLDDDSTAVTIKGENIYVDGKQLTTPTNNVSLTKNGAGNIADTGNGAITTIYEVNDEYRMVIVNEYFGKVARVTKANADKDIKRSITIGGRTFETEDFEKDDYVLYTMAWDGSAYGIESVKAAEPIENVAVTAYKGSDSVTFGGTKYNYSAKVSAFDGKGNYNMGSNNTYTFYLDSCGNVIFGEEYSVDNSNYLYILGVSSAQGTDTFETEYKNVKYVDMEGKTGVSKAASANVPTKGTWATMKDDSDNEGYKVFTDVASADVKAAVANGNKISKNSPTIATGIVANNSTVFVLETEANTFKAYTGLTNLPSYENIQPTISAVDNKAVAVNGEDGYAKVVYLNVTGADSSTAADDVIYLYKTTSTTKGYDADAKTTYWEFDAIVDGALTTVKASKATLEASGLVTVKSYNADGLITKVAAVTGTGYTSVTLADEEVASYSAPTMNLKGTTYTVADDVPVYMINTTDVEMTEETPSTALEGVADGAATVTIVRKSASDETIVAIYFAGATKVAP